MSLKQIGAFGDGVTGKVNKVEAVEAKAVVPGEVSGPGLAVSISLRNGSGATINLNYSIVTLAYGRAQAPGQPMTGPPSKPFSGTLGKGKTASGVFVFTVPKKDQATELAVSVTYSPTAPVVVFTGHLS